MVGIQFREATVDDAGTLLAIKRAAIGGIEAGVYGDAQLDAWQPDPDAVSDFERALGSDTFDVVLAQVDGTDVAYGVLNAAAGRIDAVFVHPEYSGRGIATSLVRQLESRARMHDVEELTIVSSLNAKSFYQRLDYWDFGTERRRISGIEIEFAIMHKQLGSGADSVPEPDPTA
jgi:GNAT superfamily N-acetyltransferase